MVTIHNPSLGHAGKKVRATVVLALPDGPNDLHRRPVRLEASAPAAQEIVEDDVGFYLHLLDAKANCMAETWHRNLEGAKEQAGFESGLFVSAGSMLARQRSARAKMMIMVPSTQFRRHVEALRQEPESPVWMPASSSCAVSPAGVHEEICVLMWMVRMRHVREVMHHGYAEIPDDVTSRSWTGDAPSLMTLRER